MTVDTRMLSMLVFCVHILLTIFVLVESVCIECNVTHSVTLHSEV